MDCFATIPSRLIIFLIAIGSLGVLPLCFDRPIYRLYTGADILAANNGFAANGQPHDSDLPTIILNDARSHFWRNYTPETGVRPAMAHTAWFTSSKNEFFLPVVGFPNSKDAGVFVEAKKDSRMFTVPIGASHLRWQACHVILPGSLAGAEVRINAFSRSKAAYIGFGTPYYRFDYSLPGLNFARFVTATSIALLYLILLFFPVFHLLSHRVTTLRFYDRLSVALIVTSFVCFLLFFVSYFAPTLGKIVVFAWLLLALCWVTWGARTHDTCLRRRCLLLILAGCLLVFQAAFVFSFRTVSVDYSSNYIFSPASWSTDNQIPPETAMLLARGLPLSEWPFAPWKLSDRPPLLACLLYPIAVVLGCFPALPRSPLGSMIMQTCGFGVLNLWIIPAWTLFRRLRFTQKDCLLACLFTAATPFVFFNSIYIWPKMLSGTLCLTQLLYLPRRSDNWQNPGSRWRILVSGISAGLAIVAHTGIILAVAAVYAGAMIGRHVCKLFPLILSVSIAALVVAGWSLWTETTVPTSKPLPKFFLTGSYGFEHPDESVTEATRRFYASLTFPVWRKSKTDGLKTLIGLDHEDARQALGLFDNPFAGFGLVRAYQFFFVVPSLGPLLLMILGLFFVPSANAGTGGRPTIIRSVSCACFLSFLLQFMVMMCPHLLLTYPYFFPLALHLLAAISLVLLRHCRTIQILALLNYLIFGFWWIILPAVTVATDDSIALTIALTLFVMATIWFVAEVFDLRLRFSGRLSFG
jgi:hypothetical protein